MKRPKRPFPLLSDNDLEKRDSLLLCLDEIRRWMETACSPDNRIRLQW